MPVYLDTQELYHPRPDAGSSPHRQPAAPLDRSAAACLNIGLVNNMPDTALRATERQFSALLNAASGEVSIKLTLFALPGVPRGEAAAGILEDYLPVERLYDRPFAALDALIVTGAEPAAARLTDEPYWEPLAELVARARQHTRSTIWSCLAAHAAVLALDGIERVRSEQKHFGILDCARVSEHPLTRGLPANFRAPHSRWNGLSEAELEAAGYRVLTRTSKAGVDTFVKQDTSLFLFFQGHPEYETDTLLREYRRDVGRYLRGDSEVNPLPPHGYFDSVTEQALLRLRSEAAGRRSQALLEPVSRILDGARVGNTWQGTAVDLYRNWLKWLSEQKMTAAGIRRAGSILPAPQLDTVSLEG